MKIFLSLLLLLLVTGCAPTITPLNSSKNIERSYTIGQSATVPAGQPILTVQSRSSAPSYAVIEDYMPPQHDVWKGGLDYPQLKKGMIFTKVADRSDGVIGISNPAYQVVDPGGMLKDDRSEVITLWISPSGVVSKTMEGEAWAQKPLFTEVKNEGGSSYRGELIFSGMSGDTLDALYRESSGSSDAPVATPLRFNLAGEKRIMFRDITIEVLKAGNDAIEYRVVSDDGLRWLP
jgi:hypothetical protein